MEKLKVKRLTEKAILPTRASDGDAGLDLYSVADVKLWRGEYAVVPTGIAVEIPRGYVGLVHPRSGLAMSRGITILNTPGTIDAGYRGEVKVILANLLGDPVMTKPDHIPAGTRIAQLVIQKVELPEVEVVDELSDSQRGAGGFGSTGR